MITKKRSATIDSGSQKSRACTNWWRSVRAITHARDGAGGTCPDGRGRWRSRLGPPDLEVQLLEARRTRLDPVRRAPAAHERVHEIGHGRLVARGRRSPRRCARYARTNGSHARTSSTAGSAASSTTRAAGQ